MESGWKKINHEKACDVIDVDLLDPGSSDFLDSEIRPEEFIHVLTRKNKWSDAIKVMAHILPRREAVWWACVCARQMKSLAATEAEVLALAAAEKWVFKPNDQNRLHAFLAAQKSDSPSAGTMSAMAAAHYSTSLQVTKDEQLELDSESFPQIIAAIVMISTEETEELQLESHYRHTLNSGKDIACGGNGQFAKQSAAAN